MIILSKSNEGWVDRNVLYGEIIGLFVGFRNLSVSATYNA